MRRIEGALSLYLLCCNPASARESSFSKNKSTINHGVALRILPLGASITLGLDSAGLTGYRGPLQELLEANGNSVTYVGTRHIGNMTDNAVQAISGQTIEEIDATALTDEVYRFAPNVILLNAGINNCARGDCDPAQAPADYAKLLNNIHTHLPDSLTVVSSLIPNLRSAVNTCIESLNPQIEQVAMQASAGGQKIAYVDMYDAIPASDITRKDGTHPTDAGYQIMARVWFDGLVRARSNISTPGPMQSYTASPTATPTSHSRAVKTGDEVSWLLPILSVLSIICSLFV